jgi:hypothetical protein
MGVDPEAFSRMYPPPSVEPSPLVRLAGAVIRQACVDLPPDKLARWTSEDIFRDWCEAAGCSADKMRPTILRLAEQGATVEIAPASMGQHGDVLVLRLEDDDAADL